MIKWNSTTISQYNQSPTIQTLLYGINQWFDPTQNIDNFYKMIWDVSQATGYGLDVWGRIVAVDRVLVVELGDLYWGFGEASTLSAKPFRTKLAVPTAVEGGGIFYNGELFTQNQPLDDAGFRTLIMAKAAFNICNGSIAAINNILMTLFGKPKYRGNAYVVDNQNMTMTYTFEFQPTPQEVSIIQNSGVLPRPTGVQVLYKLNVPSGKIITFTAAAISGVSGHAANTIDPHIQARAWLGGVGLLRASTLARLAARARMGGVGSVSASATVHLAQKYQSGAVIGATGAVRATGVVPGKVYVFWENAGTSTLRTDAHVRVRVLAGAMPIGATSSLRANATVIHQPQAQAKLGAVVAVRGSATRTMSIAAGIDGAGDMNPTVRRIVHVGARIDGRGGYGDTVFDVIPATARIAGAARLTATAGSRLVFASARINGVTNLRVAPAKRLVYGAARMGGDGSFRDIATEAFPAVSRLAGLGSVRASAIHVVPAAAEIDGEGELGASRGIRVVYATARMAGIASTVADYSFARVAGVSGVAGTGGLRANATGNNVGSIIHGLGSVRATGRNLTSARISGVGGVHATATVV